ncbi:hypothetical protein FBU30_002983 [Linnemannia zychae]|nr:hypothetical protein FBU30_002983 [Linnemannia zychae]
MGDNLMEYNQFCSEFSIQGCRLNGTRFDYSNNSWGDKYWRNVDVSYVVAASYLTMITLIALIMYLRNRTRLRLIVVLFSFLGVSAAIAGFLSTSRFHRWSMQQDGTKGNEKLETNIFWIWSFVAEGVGTVLLALTVVKVGTVFYPQVGRKNIFYVLSIIMILIYAAVAIANLVIYIVQTSGRAMKGSDAQLYQECIDYLQSCMLLDPAARNIPPPQKDRNNYFLSGQIKEWDELKLNPSRAIYLPNQVLTAVIFLWVSLYLFVPLLRNRKHRPVIGSDMTAVGIWYLSCLTILVLGYIALTIYFCVYRPKDNIYQSWSLALDVSLRGTFGIVFSLPAPMFIIRFVRQYYGQNRKDGDYSRTQRNFASRHQGMLSPINYSQNSGGDFSTLSSPDRTLGATAKAGVHVEDPLAFLESHSARSNNINFGSIKLFPTRNRGESMESSKVFNQDFEPDELRDSNVVGDDSQSHEPFHQYYVTMETCSVDGKTGCKNVSSDLDTKQEKDAKSPESAAMEPQRPKSALIATKSSEKETIRGLSLDDAAYTSSAKDSVVFQDDNGSSSKREPLFQDLTQEASSINNISNTITGTTGWEIGGYNTSQESKADNVPDTSSDSIISSTHPRDASNTSNISLAQPLERIKQDLVYNVGDGTVTVLPELTGLQKQLAQHQSSLLPSAIAIQHFDPAENCPPALRAQMESAFATYIDSLPPDVDIDGRIRLNSQEPDLITADTDDFKMTRHLNERFRVYQQNRNMFTYDRTYWIKHPPNPSGLEPSLSRKEKSADNTKLGPVTSPTSKLITIQPPPPNFAPPLPPPDAAGSTKKKWLPSRKSHDLDRQATKVAALKASEPDRTSSNERRGSLTNIGADLASPSKTSKPKESRLGVFSKVLSSASHKGSDRTRTSQDIVDPDRERDKPESNSKLEGKSIGLLQISAPAPATVEALAKSTSLGQLKEEDEDKGLQYYYPDPYFSLAESKRNYTSATGSTAIERGMSSSAQKHPLSSTFSDDVRSESIGSTKSPTSTTKSFDYGPLSPIPDTKKSDSTTISSKSSRGSLGSRKLSKLDLSISRNSADIVGSAPNTPLPQPTGFGSILTRSSSNSKKIGAKFKVRDGRSKSDTAPTRTSADLIQSSVANLPITTTRKPSMPSVAVSNQPSSLSPPPRQSWSRSKSFQNTAPNFSTALVSKFTEGETPMTVDVQLANDLISADTIPSSGGTRSSLASSIGSPTTDSPTLTPINELRIKPPKKDVSSSLVPSPSMPPVSSSISKPGSGVAKAILDQRTNSLDRDIERKFTASSGALEGANTGKSRPTAMELRRMTNRPQRSIDNLASAYFYKRAAEYGGPNDANGRNGSEKADMNSSLTSTGLSSPIGIPPSSPQLISSGFSYYGVSSTGGSDSGRSSPYQRDSILGQKRHHKNQSSLDYSTSGVTLTSPSSSPLYDTLSTPGSNNVVGDSGRTNSVTSSLHLIADDPWTQAMVARAQNSNLAATGSSTPSGGGGGHSHSFSQSSIQLPAINPARSPSPGLFAPSSTTYSSRSSTTRSGSG